MTKNYLSSDNGKIKAKVLADIYFDDYYEYENESMQAGYYRVWSDEYFDMFYTLVSASVESQFLWIEIGLK